MRLFVGDDWAEDHHDIELMDGSGRRLAKARLPEGMTGMARLHAMIGEQLGEQQAEQAEVVIGIETDRGPWVQALAAAGYTVLAVNPLQAARYRDRLRVSGAKSDAADAHVLADMVRTDSHQLRPVAADSFEAEAIKVVTRAHKTLIWERTRHAQRLRHALRDYFPAALAAFDDLTACDALALLAKAPDPVSAAKLTIGQISAALKRARRRDIGEKAARIQQALRTDHLGQPGVVAAAYAAAVVSQTAILTVLNEQITALQAQVEEHFGRHPAAEVILSQPGLGPILGGPGDRRIRRRQRPICLGQSPSQLRRDQPHHPSFREEETRDGPVCPQRPAHRRPRFSGFQRPDRLTRRTHLLRPGSRPRRRSSSGTAPGRQPARRHPARMPQNRHPLQRDHRLAAPQRSRRLTLKPLGCL